MFLSLSSNSENRFLKVMMKYNSRNWTLKNDCLGSGVIEYYLEHYGSRLKHLHSCKVKF